MSPSAPQTDWTELAGQGFKAWAEASADWRDSMMRLASLQADALGRIAEIGFAGWQAAFRLYTDGETYRERLLFAEDQAARVADAMQATLHDLQQTTPPPSH